MKFYQSFLSEQLDLRKKKNPRFSLRAFAKIIEMSPGQLSKLIHGKLEMSPAQATKIIEKLRPDEKDANHLLQDIHPLLGLKVVEPIITKSSLLAEDEFKLISDVSHFALLSLIRLKENSSNPLWISEKLGISNEAASGALKRLMRLGLVWRKNDRLERSSTPITTSKDIPSTAIKAYHKQNLNLAIEKIESTAVEDREYSAITMAIDPRKIKKAKKMIIEFTEKLSAELESNNPSEVYTLAVQLFPVTIRKKASKLEN